MKHILVTIALVAIMPVVAASPVHHLTSEQWAVPRSAETIINMPALAAAMNDMRANPGGRLLIRYPGGDAGTLWMNELRSWLASLGIPSSKIETVPGSANGQVIEMEVLPPISNIYKFLHYRFASSFQIEVAV